MRYGLRIAALAALALALTWTAAHAATLEQKLQKTYPLRSGGSLEVLNTNGKIVVEAWDRDEVQVQAVKKVRAGSDAKARELLQKIRIDVRQSPDGLRIETKLPRGNDGILDWLSGNDASLSVEYEIRAPRELAADLRSTNGSLRLAGTRGRASVTTTNGNATVDRVEGGIKMLTTNGSLYVVESAGSLQGTTTNGGIRAQLSAVEGEISLRSTNGGVTLQVPRDLRATLDIATTNGGIRSDLEMDGGRKTRRSLQGDVNGGGGLLKVRTTNGGVRVETQ